MFFNIACSEKSKKKNNPQFLNWKFLAQLSWDLLKEIAL